MTDRTDQHNAYLNRLRERARQIPPDQAAYDLAWRVECRAAELFQRDFPTGTMARRLPQFRSSSPDPVGDHYRRLALAEIEGAEQGQTQTPGSPDVKTSLRMRGVPWSIKISLSPARHTYAQERP